MSLKQQIKWKELYGSEALNRKFSGVIPRGIYQGFVVSAAGLMDLSISLGSHPISIALVERNGYSFAVTSDTTETFSVPAGTSGTKYLCIDALYSPGDNLSTTSIVLVSTVLSHHIVLATLTIPVSTTTITNGMISQASRTNGAWWKENATETSMGLLEIATSSEASTGTDATRAITPVTLKSTVLELFGAYLGDSGYQKFPSGLYMQWGVTPASSSSAAVSTTFPIAFPNGCKSLTFGASGSTNGFMVSIETYSNVGFTSSVYSSNTVRAAGVMVQYQAFGY